MLFDFCWWWSMATAILLLILLIFILQLSPSITIYYTRIPVLVLILKAKSWLLNLWTQNRGQCRIIVHTLGLTKWFLPIRFKFSFLVFSFLCSSVILSLRFLRHFFSFSLGSLLCLIINKKLELIWMLRRWERMKFSMNFPSSQKTRGQFFHLQKEK